MERLVTHLWNRSHGTSFRRDLRLWEVGDGWKVTMKEGQREPVERVFANEADARSMFDSIRADSGIKWKDLTGAYQRRDVSDTSPTGEQATG